MLSSRETNCLEICTVSRFKFRDITFSLFNIWSNSSRTWPFRTQRLLSGRRHGAQQQPTVGFREITAYVKCVVSRCRVAYKQRDLSLFFLFGLFTLFVKSDIKRVPIKLTRKFIFLTMKQQNLIVHFCKGHGIGFEDEFSFVPLTQTFPETRCTNQSRAGSMWPKYIRFSRRPTRAQIKKN
jgi:hypothetical protein